MARAVEHKRKIHSMRCVYSFTSSDPMGGGMSHREGSGRETANELHMLQRVHDVLKSFSIETSNVVNFVTKEFEMFGVFGI
jgi:hypothetical protein